MQLNNPSNATPQFSTAQYAGSANCKTCNQAIGSQYYRVNGTMVCPTCAERVKSQLPEDTHGAFMRGLLFGAGGAVLGLILYAAFGIITGLMVGYVSLAVGYIVGKAVKMGSRGIGGLRYQVAAVVLTYAAVSMAAIPIGISQYAKQQKKAEHTAQVQQAPPSQTTPATTEPAMHEEQPAQANPSVGGALAGLALIGLASPFLELADPVHGVIGLIILFVGIRIAWQLTRGTMIQILGPFNNVAGESGQGTGSSAIGPN